MIHVNCDPSRPTFRNLDIIDSIPENFLTLHVPVVKMWFFSPGFSYPLNN